jgi:hypothetical protein
LLPLWSPLYNAHVFGNVLGGYAQFVSPNHDPIVAVCGILLSPGKGLFFFSPVLLFALAAPFRRPSWSSSRRTLVLACLLLIAGQLVMISFWPIWYGGWSWGWRLLTEIGPPLILFDCSYGSAIAGHGLRIAAFCILGAISISVQAVGVFCYPGGAWDAFPYPVDTHRVCDWKDNPISRSFHAGIDKQPYRSFNELFHRETWTLANTWQRVAPVDLAKARWWALPAAPLDASPEYFREVSLSQLAGIINTPVLLEGAWTSNGYYSGVGHPNISGEVYGSWSGSDANTGVLRIGPFQIAKQAAIGIIRMHQMAAKKDTGNRAIGVTIRRPSRDE